jgi:serine/threonine protein kinase
VSAEDDRARRRPAAAARSGRAHGITVIDGGCPPVSGPGTQVESPAASLIQAAEHQALVAVIADRAGVAVPAIHQVIKTTDGSALLVMERVNGSSLDHLPVERVSDTMLHELWRQMDGLHRARIAHRSLRAANIMVDSAGRPWIIDFSFSELGTRRFGSGKLRTNRRQRAARPFSLASPPASVGGAP